MCFTLPVAPVIKTASGVPGPSLARSSSGRRRPGGLRILFPATLLCLAVSASGATISSFAGTGAPGFSGDGGPAVSAQLAGVNGIARGPDGALYVCDTMNHRIRRVTRDGRITTVAGSGEQGFADGPALAAKLNEPYEVRFDRDGNVCWVERLSHSIRRLDVKTGRVATLAGNGTSGFSGDGGPATQAQLNQPHSLAFDREGNLYVADVRNHRVRRVDRGTGIITTLVGNGTREPTPDGARLGSATPVAGPRALDFGLDGTLWLALREGNAIYQIDLDRGAIHHVAGTGEKGSSGDGGPARTARLNGPKGIAVGPAGDIYIADTENQVIRIIRRGSGIMERIAGNGTRGDGAEGNPLQCALNRPHGVFVDPDGSVFIGDTENHRVRVVR